MILTQNELKRILHYNPNTGIFTWKIDTGKKIKNGSIAGTLRKDGYKQITINYKSYTSHRLAWLYVHGYLPENEIDHKDQIRHHNWIGNLREVSTICNSRNIQSYSNNKTGVKGISWDIKNNKWYSKIVVNQKAYNLGRYEDFDEAVCIRLAIEQCLNWSGCDDNSSAYQYVKENIQ